MKTEVVSAAAENFAEKVKELGAVIRRGGLVAFPTETVYGLGGNALDGEAAKKIYAAKGRPSDNPLIVHVADAAQAETLAAELSPLERKLMADFWPGPLTLVVPKKPCIPPETSGGLDTVALRCPVHPAVQALIRAAGVPVAGPSANLSGRPSPTSAEDVLNDLGGRIDAIIDGGPCRIGVESTIVSCAGGRITIYRPGGLPVEALEAYAPVDIDPGIQSGDAHPKAPGMKYRHYAPSAPLTVYTGDAAKTEAAILAFAEKTDRTYGFFVSEETAAKLPDGAAVFIWGARGDENAMAHRLFEGLHYFNAHPVDQIIGEGIAASGLGLAIMNRLTKASGYHIIVENTDKI